MTLEEKAGLCSGLDFWHTKAVKRLGVPNIMVSDGPTGLRKQDQNGDHLGVNDSIKAVSFPSGCLTACSFDRDLLRMEGEVLGDACQADDIAVLLGPALNIKRSPLCGRNFEYLSEDPYLAGELGAAYTQGVQSKNIGTSVKHFAANSMEYRRMSSTSNMDERTLREIYLPAFETTVKKAKPDTIMCSYNRVNGTFASENKFLLTDVLRKEWGFDGFVVSDWGAVNDRVAGLKAGLDLEMPASGGDTDKQIAQAVRDGKLDEAVLDTAVERILKIVYKFLEGRQKGNFDKNAHHLVTAQIAAESMILLKNEKNILPLKEKDASQILFVGAFAQKPRYEGGGSSHINAFKVTGALQAAKDAGLNIKWEQGFDIKESKAKDAKLLKAAVAAAKKAKTVVIFAGLPDSYESEGYDRSHMKLPANQNILIEEIAKVNKNVVVVLHNGSPVEMPWVKSAKAILESYLGGQAVGIAQIDLLFGRANPSGKLAESFPIKLQDNPSYLNYPGNGTVANYAEGIFVGYRYYDKKEMDVLFPFGHGLSYTTFEYSALKVDAKKIKGGQSVVASVKVKNTGKKAGKEIVQFYVAAPQGMECKPPYREPRPKMELKGFEKVELKPGETKTVTVTLDARAFSVWDESLHDWYVPGGMYQILAAASSRDVRLSAKVEVEAAQELPFRVTPNTVFEEIMENPKAFAAAKAFKGGPLSDTEQPQEKRGKSARESISDEMQLGMLKSLPIRAMRSFNQVSQEQVDGMVDALNSAVNGK